MKGGKVEGSMSHAARLSHTQPVRQLREIHTFSLHCLDITTDSSSG